MNTHFFSNYRKDGQKWLRECLLRMALGGRLLRCLRRTCATATKKQARRLGSPRPCISGQQDPRLLLFKPKMTTPSASLNTCQNVNFTSSKIAKIKINKTKTDHMLMNLILVINGKKSPRKSKKSIDIDSIL